MDAASDILNRYGLYGAAAVGLAVSFLASGIETGVYQVNRIRLRLRADAGDPRARTLRGLLADLPGLIITILIANNVGNYVLTASVTAMVAGWATGGDLGIQLTATGIVTPILYVFCEVLPKTVFAFSPTGPMCRLARPIRGAYAALTVVGLVPALKGISGLVLRIARGRRGASVNPFHPRQRLRAMLREGAAEGVITGYQDDLVEKVLSLRDRRVRHAMIPLSRVTSVSADIGRDAFVRQLRSHSYSRLPLWEGRRANIVGIVHIRDVLASASERLDLRALMERDPVTVSPEMPVGQALLRMRRRREAMAVVRDTRGRSRGILTIKDLVEEIVGELPVW